ncbi:MAG: hypothetical protein ACI9U2_000156 [Bradymonadia bacterium]|jgi:hypothetical protein
MKSAQSWGLVALLTGVAGLALWTTHRHYAARDAESAVVSLMTHRFDGTTRSRLNAWLETRRTAGHVLSTSTQAELPGPFASHVDVSLRVDDATYRFSVGIRDRLPTPVDAEARALLTRLRADVVRNGTRK